MRKTFMALGALTLLAAPATAGSVGVFGSWWDTDAADAAAGVGALFDFDVGRGFDLEFRGSYFDDLTAVIDTGDETIDAPFTATILDFGVTYNFGRVKGKKTNFYLGGAASYYTFSLDYSNQGNIDDEAGWLLLAGVDTPIGGNWVVFFEAMWREAEMDIKGNDLSFSTIENGVDLRGAEANLGFAFRW
jgi:hypothetical protein